jgi:hypothetical protein
MAADLNHLEGQYAQAVADSGIPQGVVYPAGASLGSFTMEALQAACDEAFTTGKRVVASGALTSSSTLTIKCSADMTGLTFTYMGAGVAVQLGDPALNNRRLSVRLPQILNGNKVAGTGWAGVAGSVGVKAVNLVTCPDVMVPRITGFETGLLVYGQGEGNVYNTYTIGNLENNQVNLRLDADATGWANQNTFIGGCYSHESIEGTAVAGTRHIVMTAGLANTINNNTWLNPSVEGETAEFIVDFAGSYNMIINGRYEASVPRIRWQNASFRNMILWGYGAHNIVETFGTAASANVILASSVRWAASGATPVFRIENASSSANPSIAIMEAGARQAGADPATAYAVHVGATMSRYKRAADAFDRVQIDAQNGRLYFGSGTVAPTRYFDNMGATSVRLNAAHLMFGTDNTNDIGAAGATRPRHIYQGGYHDISEMTAPAAPAADTARLFVQDNGSGKTQLMVRFPTGAAVQVAIEP